jgi:predicted AAA+ superfamily ATPase
MYKRQLFHTIKQRVQEKRRFIQVVAGPRQVGKTTLLKQLFELGVAYRGQLQEAGNTTTLARYARFS